MVKSSSKIQTLTLSLVDKQRYYVMFDFGGAIVAAADAPSIIRLIGWPIYQPTMMDKATW